MKMRILIVACILMLGWSCATSAGLIVSTDMDSSLPGVQSHREVTLGEEFDVGIVFTLTGDTSLSSYGFSVRYNSDVFGFLQRVETPPPPLGEWDPSNPEVTGSGDPILGPGNYGELRRFDAVTVGNGPVAPREVQVATLTFKATAIPDPAYTVQVLPGLFEGSGFEGFFDNGGNDLESELTFEGGGVSVVPEPSSLLLLSTGLSVGFAIMRSRRHARRK